MKIIRLMPLLFLIIISACTTTKIYTPYPTLDNSKIYFPQSTDSITSDDSDQNYSSNSNDDSWLSGGTLHKSTIAEWRKASYSNRLATSADMVVSYLDIYDFSDMDKIKQEATDLEECISITASGGDADDEQVSFIAALCLVSLWPK